MAHDRKEYENIDEKSTPRTSTSSVYSNPLFSDSDESKTLSNPLFKTSPSHIDPNEQSPYEEVAFNIPNTDDPQMLCVTFRSVTIGILLTCCMSFVSQFFAYRTAPLDANIGIIILLSYSLGEIVSLILPTKIFDIHTNPGPMTVKEHALVLIMAASGFYNYLILETITIQRIYYHFYLSHLTNIVLIIIIQCMAVTIASILKRFLIWPGAMIWPRSILGSSFIITLVHTHDRSSNQTPQWTMSRAKFFWIMVLIQSIYYWLPGYMFPLLSAFSFVCLLAPNNVVLSQITGTHGLSIGALQFDWNAWVAYLDSPILVPFWAHVNVFLGFVLVIWVLTPILYYTNTWNALKMPIISNLVFDRDGHYYDTPTVLGRNRHLNLTAFELYGEPELPASTAISYGFTFAALTAVIVHTILYNGRSILESLRLDVSDPKNDIHTKLIARYPDVSTRWYILVLLLSLLFGLLIFDYVELLPSYGFLIAVIFTLTTIIPYGILNGMTNMAWTNTSAPDLFSSVLLKGNPVGFLTFRALTYGCQSQILNLLSNFKLAHYMKIPPRTAFIAVIGATIVSGLTNYITAIYLLNHVQNICSPRNALWRCLNAENSYTASIIFSVAGSFRLGHKYSSMLFALPIGAVLPFLTWLLCKRFPNHTWLALINVPIILLATNNIPPAPAAEFVSWFLVGFIFNFIIYRYAHMWWEKYAYTFSAAMSCGVAIAGLLIFFLLELPGITFPQWWGLGGPSGDGCPLGRANYSGIIPTRRT